MLFGIRWLNGEAIEFKPVTGFITIEDVRRTLLMLDVAKETSRLPEKCPNVAEFRSFQRDVRRWQMGHMTLGSLRELYER